MGRCTRGTGNVQTICSPVCETTACAKAFPRTQPSHHTVFSAGFSSFSSQLHMLNQFCELPFVQVRCTGAQHWHTQALPCALWGVELCVDTSGTFPITRCKIRHLLHGSFLHPHVPLQWQTGKWRTTQARHSTHSKPDDKRNWQTPNPSLSCIQYF